MAKQRHQDTQTSSSKNTLIVMAIGALLVAGLVGWALTRTVETSTVTTAEGYTQPPNATAGSTPGEPPIGETSTGTSMPSTSAPISALPPSGPVGDRATVARIAPEDLRNQLNAGAVTLIDVRAADAYATGHIPGSINIPFASMEGQVDIIPKGKPIVTYCT
jgi:hypothetical protein